ncbi:uncharacterized protein DDB_G0283697-like isoform X2 [Penaeus indicus]|uniref:uncharacterized protein DDB_G0283697-like isoform X2 n=1 Tax=Penaeus indicus TaxID=29960 RepID=UPI00300C0928
MKRKGSRSERSVEDEEQSSEGSEEDEEEGQSSERSVEDEEQSSEGSEEDEEEGQSSERSVEDEEQSSEGSEEDEEEGQSSEGSDRAGYEYTTDEEDNDPSGEQDSESDEEDKEGSESSEESSRQPEQQGPKEQRSKQNPKESRRKKDLGNQTQLHKRERKKSQGKTPSPAKPAEKLGTNQDIPRQKGTPPQSTRPAKKPSTSGTATKIRDTRGEKGKTKQVGKPKQERITKRPKSGEHKKAESPRINGKRASDREERNPNTSTEMENRARMSRKYPKTSRKGDFDSSSEEDFRKKRPNSRDLRTFSKDDYDYDDHDYSSPSKSDVRKVLPEERRSKNREGRHYGNDEGSRKQVIREINAGWSFCYQTLPCYLFIFKYQYRYVDIIHNILCL